MSGPIRAVLDLFSSIWLGVTLLACLFVYSAIGSSGVPTHPNILDPAHWQSVRQWRAFEMTEFEWFHWWPFKTLIALICTNLVIATLRRIPFNVINLGVWMIHTGIITLALGSVWYFSTKVEGDAPVNRRRIVVQAPGMNETESMAALPGNSMVIGKGDDAYVLQVRDIDPQWELLSGDDKGRKAYKVSVMVQSKGGMFIRELIAGRPEYTQDLIRSNDPKQPFTRAVKALGKPLVDEAIQVSLDYDPQEYFYLMDSRAVYLRELGQKEWVQRPIHNLPRYNDYIASSDDAWGEMLPRPDPIDVEVPSAEGDDPLPDVTFRISRYLRYANIESRRRPDPSGPLSPVMNVRLDPLKGSAQQYQLIALDADQNSALQGNLQFVWVNSAEQIESLKHRTEPSIRFAVPGTAISVEQPVTDLLRIHQDAPFVPIDGTEYSYRVEALEDRLNIEDKTVSVAIVQIKTPQRAYTRWVFDDPSKNRDMAMAEPGVSQHEAQVDLDKSLETVYTPAEFRPPILLAAGPGEQDLAMIVTKVVGQPTYTPIVVGQQLPVTEGVSLTVQKYASRTTEETKPFVVSREQRDRDVGENLSMIRLDVPLGDGGTSVWLPFHLFAFASPEAVLRRFPYRPQVTTLADGRQIEMMFSRARLPLPAPVALDDFKVATHIGGFTGQTSSILDWTSVIRFADNTNNHPIEGSIANRDLFEGRFAGWSQPLTARMNKPAEYNGFWYFQAQWDPPDQPRFEGDPGSRGLNYTVLGVGNRNGVHVQLAGACLAVLGMIFSFYIKPIIKRCRQQAVYAEAGEKKRAAGERRATEPVGAAWKAES